ncbi:AraC family transcriptional regulator [Hymenobacter terrenus]|uniref:AraC family transcriptional regulator n=1 Tax=Hymenobacter terrenus TaxID=1629124 RepID=UPI000B32F498|nr:AraC family transcriptional regulator [Hymenobacter terrenus]
MKTQLQYLPESALSPLARAGVLIKNLKNLTSENDCNSSGPHRDAHYLLVLATQGWFNLTLDFEEIVVTAPALLVILPGQVHQILQVTDPQGWTISFDSSLMDKEVEMVLAKGMRGPLLLTAQTAFYEQVLALLHLLSDLHSGKAEAYTGRTTQSLLGALLSLVAGQLVNHPPISKKPKRCATFIEQTFTQLLHRHYSTWKKPSQYAAALALSVAHLNDTIKGITGASVSSHIQQRAILEAKRLLYFTERSVKDIGYEVGYDEAVYFGKLFKKVTGLTPLQFRQQFRN